MTLVSELGVDMSPWPTVKRFASWLALCPANNVSGGKVLRRGKRRTANRAAQAFRMAASSLHHSDSALGAFYRRKRAQLGPQKAMDATAHRLARIYYHMMKYKTAYVDLGAGEYEERFRAHQMAVCARMAKKLGMRLEPLEATAMAS